MEQANEMATTKFCSAKQKKMYMEIIQKVMPRKKTNIKKHKMHYIASFLGPSCYSFYISFQHFQFLEKKGGITAQI